MPAKCLIVVLIVLLSGVTGVFAQGGNDLIYSYTSAEWGITVYYPEGWFAADTGGGSFTFWGVTTVFSPFLYTSDEFEAYGIQPGDGPSAVAALFNSYGMDTPFEPSDVQATLVDGREMWTYAFVFTYNDVSSDTLLAVVQLPSGAYLAGSVSSFSGFTLDQNECEQALRILASAEMDDSIVTAPQETLPYEFGTSGVVVDMPSGWEALVWESDLIALHSEGYTVLVPRIYFPGVLTSDGRTETISGAFEQIAEVSRYPFPFETSALRTQSVNGRELTIYEYITDIEGVVAAVVLGDGTIFTANIYPTAGSTLTERDVALGVVASVRFEDSFSEDLPDVSTGPIVFLSNRGDGTDIFTMNGDGSEVQPLTDDMNYEVAPSWSPDRSRIAFSSDQNGNQDIFVMNADGSNVQPLTDSSDPDAFPSWSPDGSQIAFQAQRDGNAEIYVMNADGSDQRNLTHNSAADRFPSWSPDGSQIVFSTDRDGNSEIYVMNVDGSDQRNLTVRGSQEFGAVWSPNGNLIAFGSDRDGNLEIYVMNADGSSPRNLTNSSADEYSPAWSPDGTWIAFVWGDAGSMEEIYVMKSNGTNVHNLTLDNRGDWAPNW